VNGAIRIGEWTVDRQGNRLCRAGETVRVEPKVMDLLMLLAEHRGEVVARDQMLAALWAGTIVGEEALTQCAIKLRRALRDSPRNPRYIQTVSKRGYRLIAPVMPAEVRAEQAASSAPAIRGATRRRWLLLWGGLAAAALAASLIIFTAQPAGDPIDAERRADAIASPIPVAVEPFDYLGLDGRSYVAAGITDDLASDLSRAHQLRVVRSEHGHSTRPDLRYSVSGSVQQDSGVVRINVFLTDAVTGDQLWAGRFEQAYDNLFALQDEIARRVLAVLPARIDDAERRRVARRYTRSLAAYDAFQHGQAMFLARTREDNEAARALYRQAIALDPRFARAYASLAMTYAMDDRLGAPARSSLARASALAESARQIDPDDPRVLWALAFVHAQARRLGASAEVLGRAIELDPSFADAYALLGGVRTYGGRPGDTIPLIRTAMRLNPDAGYLYFLLLGRAYFFENDVEQALVNLRAAAERNPADVETRVFLAATLAASGDVAAAQWEADEVRTLRPAFSARAWLATYPMTSERQRERLLALLDTVRL